MNQLSRQQWWWIRWDRISCQKSVKRFWKYSEMHRGGRREKDAGRSCWFPWKVLWNTRERIWFAVSPLILLCGVCWWLSECGNAGRILRAPSQMRCIVSGYVHAVLAGCWAPKWAKNGSLSCFRSSKWSRASLKSRGTELWRRWHGGHSLTTPLSGSVHSKEAQCLSGWCFKWEQRNLLVTAPLVYPRSTFTFVCELRATQWGLKRRSQVILQGSSVEGGVILKEILSHQLLRHRLKVNMQIHLRSAASSSLVLWAFFLNQRAIVQALCWGRTKSLIFFFFS